MSQHTLCLTEAMRTYMHSLNGPEDPVLSALRQHTQTLPNAHMQSSPEAAQLLALLSTLVPLPRVLEIGTFTGYTTLAIAQALPDTGHIVTCDTNPKHVAIAQQFWNQCPAGQRIQAVVQPGLTYMQAAPAQSWGLVFIDADKRTYPAYYQEAKRLVCSGGLIVVDNTLGFHNAYLPTVRTPQTEAIDTTNQHIQKDPQAQAVLLPIGDGLTLIRITHAAPVPGCEAAKPPVTGS